MRRGRPGRCSTGCFARRCTSGRRCGTQTAIGESPASVSSAAAALAQQVFGELDGRKILVIGAGKVSEQAARNLLSRGATIAWWRTAPSIAPPSSPSASAARRCRSTGSRRSSSAPTSSSPRRARPATCSGASRSSERCGAQGSTSVPDRPRGAARPRARIHELDGCYLYDIDDLQAVVAETLAARRSEAERAEAIVLEEADKFHAWQASLDVVPAIASLRARAEEIREGSSQKARGRLSEREPRPSSR